MPQKIASTKDLLLVLLYAPGASGEIAEPIVGRTRLMKMVFLFSKELRTDFALGKAVDEAAIPDFEPYDFGPFSPKVYADLEFLIDLGFVIRRPFGATDAPPEEVAEYEHWRADSDDEDDDAELDQFSLSELGQKFVKSEQAGVFTKEQWDILREFKSRCTSTSLSALLHYVYSKYPDMTTKSTIREKVLGPEGQ